MKSSAKCVFIDYALVQAQNANRKALVLYANVGGRVAKVLISPAFRSRLGVLTVVRRKAIMNTMPETVTIVERDVEAGRYLALAEDCLDEWAKRAQSRMAS
ncbi:MAG: hypothetical protein ABIA47_00275 [bacterium]